MIERRYGEYGLRGILWVARRDILSPDRAVIARGRINTYKVFEVVLGMNGPLVERKEFYTYDAACNYAETLIVN